MMSNQKFDSFINLIQFDQETANVKKDLTSLTTDLKILKQQQEDKKIRLTQFHDAWISSRKQVDTKELEMKELDQREKEQKKRFDASKNEKEYRSAKHEIEAIQEQQKDLEVELIAVWQQLEHAEKEYKKEKELIEGQEVEIKKSVTEKEAAIKKEEEVLRCRLERRQEKVNVVPQEWLEKYQGMAERVADPVVAVQQQSCSACFHIIVHEDMARLENNKLLQCKGCYRFLYIPQNS